MNAREKGFLLLSSQLGDPLRRPLTAPQLRKLGNLARNLPAVDANRQLTARDLIRCGCGRELAERVILLLSDEEQLECYLRRGIRLGCTPFTRVSEGYPIRLRRALGADSPACIWAKGDLSLLGKRAVSLAGSREISGPNRDFAARAGYEAAIQGYVLVSGNARGADSIAQKAALQAGGCVIAVVPDELEKYSQIDRMLYISADDYDAPFSAQRALRRNDVIHGLGECVVIAQSGYQKGGTWNGTVKNLRAGWSPVFCYDDASLASQALQQMGAEAIAMDDLRDYSALNPPYQTFYD